MPSPGGTFHGVAATSARSAWVVGSTAKGKALKFKIWDAVYSKK